MGSNTTSKQHCCHPVLDGFFSMFVSALSLHQQSKVNINMENYPICIDTFSILAEMIMFITHFTLATEDNAYWTRTTSYINLIVLGVIFTELTSEEEERLMTMNVVGSSHPSWSCQWIEPANAVHGWLPLATQHLAGPSGCLVHPSHVLLYSARPDWRTRLFGDHRTQSGSLVSFSHCLIENARCISAHSMLGALSIGADPITQRNTVISPVGGTANEVEMLSREFRAMFMRFQYITSTDVYSLIYRSVLCERK